jgi:hypothetical protein
VILVATPTRGEVLAGFTADLVQLIKADPKVDWLVATGTYLPNLRTALVGAAKAYSHILFIDSDMRFPPDTPERLLKHDLDIVGANCPQRTQKGTTAFIGQKQVPSLGKSGLQKVDSLGMGVTLIKTSVFDKIPAPWFATPYDGNKFVGEDVFFCHKAREHGFNIWIDHELSLEIKHTGTIDLTHKETI